jgi:hypothetical protein
VAAAVGISVSVAAMGDFTVNLLQIVEIGLLP